MKEIVLKSGDTVLIYLHQKDKLSYAILNTRYSKEEMDKKTILELNHSVVEELKELGYTIRWELPFVLDIRKMDYKTFIESRRKFVMNERLSNLPEQDKNYTIKIFDRCKMQEIIDSGYKFPSDCISIPFYKRRLDAEICYNEFYANTYVGVAVEIDEANY